MKFALGSKSERKIAVVIKIIKEYSPEVYSVVGIVADSNVPETPWDKETYDGAKNRAYATKQVVEDADYFIGLESGLVERYGTIFEEAWCCIIAKDGNEFFGYSSGLRVPDYILSKMKTLNLPHHRTMVELEREHNLIESDTWGIYSGNMILREISLEEAVRNALIQTFATNKSFYKKI